MSAAVSFNPSRVLLLGCGSHLEDGAYDCLLPLRENLTRFAAAGIELELDTAPTVEAFVERAAAFRGDLLVTCFSWKERPDAVVAALRSIRAGRSGKLAHYDYPDPLNSRYWPALPYVDYFLKPHRSASLDTYTSPSATGCPFPDFLAGQMGVELAGWHYRSEFPVDQASKVRAAWSYGAMGRYRRLARLTERVSLPFRWRPIDINTRFSVTGAYPGSWYHRYRQHAMERIRGISGVRLSSPGRMRFRRYVAELTLTKIVVSPFGWGEVCYRDYEAVAAGALLLKPSMDHVRTTPDIFAPGETYVPLRWDLSDLEEKCRYYLARPDEAQRIIREARRRYLDYFRNDELIALFRTLLAE